MTTPSQAAQENIKFNLKQLAAANAEMANITAFYHRLLRDTLAEMQRYIDARLEEDKAQRAEAAALSEVSR